jgi:hypothetical protein
LDSVLAVSVDERIKVDGFGARESPPTHVHLSPKCHPIRGASKRKRLDSVLAVSMNERVRFGELGAGDSLLPHLHDSRLGEHSKESDWIQFWLVRWVKE